MSGSVQFHVPEVRLAKLLKEPGGKPVVQALKDAGKGLEGLRDECLIGLGQTLDQAELVVKNARGVPQQAVVSELYRIVSGALGAASACGLSSLDTLLHSLSNLLDNLKVREVWEGKAVSVHLQTFRLLLHTERTGDEAGVQTILEGLRQVNARVTKP